MIRPSPRECRTSTRYIPLVLVFLSGPASSQVLSQPLVYGSSPRIIENQNIVPLPEAFRIDANTTCPTPSLGLSGFAARGSDFIATNSFSNASGTSGIDNYGAAASLRIPLAGGLAKACRDYAEAKARFEMQRAANQLVNSQSLLLKQCKWVINTAKIDFDAEEFDEKAFSRSFGTLLACKDVANMLKKVKNNSDFVGDPGASTESFSKPVETRIERQQIEVIR